MGLLSLCVIIVLLQACTTARLTDKEITEAKITLKELLELEGTEHENGLKALNKRIRTASKPVDQNPPELDCSGSAYQRIACIGAYGGIDMRTCESIGCCFDDSVPNTHWCFSPKGVCDGSPFNRVVCPGAYSGITASDCHKKGCCFDSRVSRVPYCYIQ